ncbi:protein YIPF6 [Copidosoma floridanum]|uniref:protein YIPF6 n=1 Tax=Copidosoma floridanum TaxID=29053 RepID=UPI0006C971B4|nr:protein YIPF6 [Copidosoma floridanum]XP_014219121.1 protein YIPF6 [Copidosoma floridanum]XP_014219122.1 protein YIPF6 [Copidosoma floridanum]
MAMNEARFDMFDDGISAVDPQHVQGDMTVGPNLRSQASLGEPDFSTLDEPIKDTILRDLRAVGRKFYHVLYPKEKKSLLKEWDLWGPLVLCTFMAMILQGSSDTANSSNDGGPEFAEVFVIVWIGSMVVTLNSKLLGGNISFFQSVCVLGYCLLPTAIALIICRIILIVEQNFILFILRFIIAMIGFVWATYASMAFLGDSQPSGKKALAVYPIFLFYFIISWLVISHTK